MTSPAAERKAIEIGRRGGNNLVTLILRICDAAPKLS